MRRSSTISGTKSSKHSDTDTSGIYYHSFWLLPAVGLAKFCWDHWRNSVGAACLDRVGLGRQQRRPTLGLGCGNSKHRVGPCHRKEETILRMEQQGLHQLRTGVLLSARSLSHIFLTHQMVPALPLASGGSSCPNWPIPTGWTWQDENTFGTGDEWNMPQIAWAALLGRWRTGSLGCWCWLCCFLDL